MTKKLTITLGLSGTVLLTTGAVLTNNLALAGTGMYLMMASLSIAVFHAATAIESTYA